jgi:hypothetical protein
MLHREIRTLLDVAIPEMNGNEMEKRVDAASGETGEVRRVSRIRGRGRLVSHVPGPAAVNGSIAQLF